MTQNVAVNDEPGALSTSSSRVDILTNYFEARQEKMSAKIYRNLTLDPVVSVIFRRKEPTYRELVLVVSTVVSALDNRIEELEKSTRPWDRLSNTLNAPLLSAKPVEESKKEAKDEGVKGEEESDSHEAKWLLKYLTLRNLGGALLTVLTLSTGFFAFINRDYRSLLDARDKRIEDLAEELKVREGALEQTKEQLRKLDSKSKSIEGRLVASGQQTAALQGRIKELERKRDEAVVKGADGQVQLAKELGDARVKIGELERDLSAANANLETVRNNWATETENASSRSKTMKDLETKLSTAQTRLNSAIDSWNSLLNFLGSQREGWKIEMKGSELRAHLETLERYTSRVDGMLSQVP